MEDIFQDISKYYAANIVDNVLTIGKIVYLDGSYSFIRDDIKGPFNLHVPRWRRLSRSKSIPAFT
jgi:hypothetical protein